MLSEKPPDGGLENRLVPFRVQPAAMHDADAAMAIVATVLDEPLHAGDGLGGGDAMQVERVGCDVVSASELSQLTPVNAGSDEPAVRSCVRIIFDRGTWMIGCTGQAHLGSRANASPRIWWQPDDICHRTREILSIRVRRGGPVVSRVGAAAFLGIPLHVAILPWRSVVHTHMTTDSLHT